MFKRFAACAALILTAAVPAAAQEPPTTEVVIATEMGDITVALETERAPKTSANFLRYVDAKRLDGTTFYRAMRLDWGTQPNGLIQGGLQNDPKQVFPPVAHERTSDTGVKHVEGAISMARYDPGTATADFSITVSPQPGLDADSANVDPNLREGYAAFGHVTKGMVVARAIFAAPVDPAKGDGFMKGQMLAKPVKIFTVRRAIAPSAAAK
jgi:peptidyl-prolyl cis-trans isomerase A (cyclophilin A)